MLSSVLTGSLLHLTCNAFLCPLRQFATSNLQCFLVSSRAVSCISSPPMLSCLYRRFTSLHLQCFLVSSRAVCISSPSVSILCPHRQFASVHLRYLSCVLTGSLCQFTSEIYPVSWQAVCVSSPPISILCPQRQFTSLYRQCFLVSSQAVHVSSPPISIHRQFVSVHLQYLSCVLTGSFCQSSSSIYLVSSQAVRVSSSPVSILCPRRQFASRIKRPYEVHYDPYTQTIELLNSKGMLHQLARNLHAELDNLQRAIDRIQNVTMAD